MGLPAPNHQNDGNEKSELRKLVEHKAQQTISKKSKQALKKVGKKAAKLAAKAIKVGIQSLLRLLLQFLGYLVGPTILMFIGISILVIIIIMITTFMFGNGQGLNKKTQPLYNYMVSNANATIDPSKPEQVPYRVPIQLITAAIEIKLDTNKNETTSQAQQLISSMATNLAPKFTYNNFNEWTGQQVTVCEENKCTTKPVVRTNHEHSKLTNVNAWNGQTTITYTGQVTPWVSSTSYSYSNKSYTTKVPVQVPYTVNETKWVMDMSPQQTTVKVPVTKYKKVPYTVNESEIVFNPITHQKMVLTVPVTKYKKVKYTAYKTETTTSILPHKVKITFPVTKYKTVMKTVKATKKVKVATTTKTREMVYSGSSQFTESYQSLDQVLASNGYGLNDKQLIDVFYEFAATGSKDSSLPPINYASWLQTGTVSSGGGSGGNFGGLHLTGGSGASLPFVLQDFVKPAQQLQNLTGFPASVTLAQIVDESQVGGHLSGLASQAKNLFGIKGVGTAGSVVMMTHEVYGGITEYIPARFAAYKTFYDSMYGHAVFLSGPRYARLFVTAHDPVQYAVDLQRAGYATDPLYAQKLVNIINFNGLHKYDTNNYTFNPVH